MKLPVPTIHPAGEGQLSTKTALAQALEVDTYDGKVHVEWDQSAAVTPLGQLSFFIQYLKIGGRLTPWVEDCPLAYRSNNAPSRLDVLGSLLLSILSGHTRYAHLGRLANDRVNAQLLGMKRIVSDDSARRALTRMNERDAIAWMCEHLRLSYEPLLDRAWILDVDVTVKCLYGHQEKATVGYNPKKPGRPSHTYHSYLIANLRLVLDVEVQAGDRSHSTHSLPGLVNLLLRLPPEQRPAFVRGDCDWGNDTVMRELEDIGQPYLFKVRKSKGVKRLIQEAHYAGDWVRFNKDFDGKQIH
ncbi:MAG: transposase [Gammaproteobacteria bacterium]|nr:transposase [Gammaproteobacteria bacterium]